MMQAVAKRSLWILPVISVLILLPGCVPEATVREEEPEQSAESTLFYPPLPNPPRIQYLATFSTTEDLKTGDEEETGKFARFILGDEDKSDVKGIKKPYGVAIYEGKIYVTDLRGDGYGVFDLQKNSYDFISESGAGTMPSPINITIDIDGTKYITDTVKEQVLVFDLNDTFVRAYGFEGQFRPGDVAIDGNKLYISDLDHHNIQVLDKATGDLLLSFGEPGADVGKLYFPTNLSIGPDHYLYISDTGNFRVEKYTLDGEFIRNFGEIGDVPGKLARPKGIALDRDGNLYVVDAAFQNVQVFNSEGELLMFFGEPSKNHPSGLDLPTDIIIDYSNISYFQRFADPKFQLEYVILVANQFGPNKVVVYGFGKMDGMSYTEDEL